MLYRLVTLLGGVLLCVGCQETTPASSPAATPQNSPVASPAASATIPADPDAPVATLLGKPVYRRDFLDQGDSAQAEVKFRGLILSALMEDFCQREGVAITPEEIDAFWQTLQSAGERSTGQKPPVRDFDEAKIQAQLDETKAKLANKDVPWLERLQLAGLQRSLAFALEHKTVAAHEAYNHLMPLRCQQALYEKYGGKVVGMQISIEPVGAYQSLIEEAEASGRLAFHDAELEQSFRNRLSEYASRQEVPPELVDFSLPLWLQVTLQRPAESGTTSGAPPAEAPPKVAGSKTARRSDGEMLTHFVGAWQTRVTQRPSKWTPEAGESTVQEVTQWALQNKFILGREHNQTDGRKSLWVMTYDPQKSSYPFWMFDSRGLMGGQWQLNWDADARTATGHAIDTPAGWTSHGTNQFPDDSTNNVHYWMKDDTGTLLMEATGTKRRQPAEAAAACLAAWSKPDPQEGLPAELQLLGRLVGTWDVASTRKQLQGSTSETQLTGTTARQWILDGRFVMGTMEMSDGSEGLALFSYDPDAKEYRNWFFNSLGHRYASRGRWDDATQTLSLTAPLDGGRTTKITVRLESTHRELWQTEIADASGSVLVDMRATLTRQSNSEGGVP